MKKETLGVGVAYRWAVEMSKDLADMAEHIEKGYAASPRGPDERAEVAFMMMTVAEMRTKLRSNAELGSQFLWMHKNPELDAEFKRYQESSDRLKQLLYEDAPEPINDLCNELEKAGHGDLVPKLMDMVNKKIKSEGDPVNRINPPIVDDDDEGAFPA